MKDEEIIEILDEWNQWLEDFGYVTDTAGMSIARKYWMAKLKFMEYKKPKDDIEEVQSK